MKATMKQLATGTFIALLLMVVNVKAEGTETISTKNEIIETSLQLEKWMMDESIWNTNSAMIANFVQETEAELELESWMTSTEVWNTNYIFTEEMETGLGLENWMTNDQLWKVNAQEKEKNLELEAWMTDENIWK